ncbi:hypothetical protein Q0Z83_002090 [Actinoplanes sichuanensis]|uniref:WXG100 family type VII secretion target n=1 Tax=Actinoplanes sichuanensis TaxID=512349 RepID=A0ABW4ARA1_9ACTN|nr:hypothetical protein [Actinoplanes sichuanensis]BEL02018.1 hypothetical protein Q0Z83_002090 [Actinoplanes sichuanensis]
MAETDLVTPADLAGQAYQQAVRDRAGKLKQELIRQTLEDAASWTRAVNDKWANAHPGEWDGLPIDQAEVDRYRQQVSTQDYEWVIPSFERFLDPDPDALDPIIAALATIEALLDGNANPDGTWTGVSPALGRINDVRDDLKFWDGAFKDNFIDYFVTPLQTVVPNQREVIKYTRSAIEGSKIVHIRMRRAVLNLLDQGIKAAQQLSNGACTGADVLKWGSIAMCVVGTAVGGLVTGPAAVLAGAVLVDVGGTILNGLVPPDEEKTKLELAAETATGVASNILNAQSVLGNDTYVAEEGIARSLRSLHQLVVEGRLPTLTSNASGPFGVATPALADADPRAITGGYFRPGGRHGDAA